MPADPRDFQVELSTFVRPAIPAAIAAEPAPQQVPNRPFLSVHFSCCGMYQRIYRSADGTRYSGNCPRCAKPVRFVVGSGGTASRSFTAW